MKFLFYKPIKITSELDTEVSFWSDTHFGHKCEHWERPLWSARGFSSVEDHDEALIQRWNEKCNNNSVIFHLGDFMFGFSADLRFIETVNKLNFKELYIMSGNHTSGWKQIFEKQRNNVLNLSETKRVIFIPNYVEAIVNDVFIVLSHYPIASYNKQARGSLMLHGHCHGNLYKSEIGPLLYKSKILDVGVETCSTPITLAELKDKFNCIESFTYDEANK